MGDRAVWLPTLFWVLELALWLAGLVWRVDPMCWSGRQAGNLGTVAAAGGGLRARQREVERRPLQE